MTDNLSCSLLTPQGTLFSGTVWQVTAPGESGRFSIRKDHAPIIASLAAGTLEIAVSATDRRIFSLESGILRHCGNTCTVICPGALVAEAGKS